MRLILPLLILAQGCFAQICLPEAQPQPNSAYAYVRAEVKALHWIRAALAESQKIESPRVDDPERLHKLVTLYSASETVSDDYTCAASMLEKYKDSKIESIGTSVVTLLVAINTTKEINAKLLSLMEAINKATKPEDIDQVEIAKLLGNVQAMQKDVRTMAMLGVKMSTFAIVQTEGEGDSAKPVAFTITPAQRATLLAEVQELAKKQTINTYVDACADLLLGTLNRPLRTSPQ